MCILSLKFWGDIWSKLSKLPNDVKSNSEPIWGQLQNVNVGWNAAQKSSEKSRNLLRNGGGGGSSLNLPDNPFPSLWLYLPSRPVHAVLSLKPIPHTNVCCCHSQCSVYELSGGSNHNFSPLNFAAKMAEWRRRPMSRKMQHKFRLKISTQRNPFRSQQKRDISFSRQLSKEVLPGKCQNLSFNMENWCLDMADQILRLRPYFQNWRCTNFIHFWERLSENFCCKRPTCLFEVHLW